MKFARIEDTTVRYYAKPKPTKQKRDRWPVIVGERKCWSRFTAMLRKMIYETI